jgi:hypothetical protein
MQVRDQLIKEASANSSVARYGDLITDEAMCTRFVKGCKGYVSKSVEMFKAHLEWRVDYQLDTIVDEHFPDLEAPNELYWAGRDKDGVMTLMWRLQHHDARRTDAKRFVRFFVHQIEKGLRTCVSYPNAHFNIGVDLANVVRTCGRNLPLLNAIAVAHSANSARVLLPLGLCQYRPGNGNHLAVGAHQKLPEGTRADGRTCSFPLFSPWAKCLTMTPELTPQVRKGLYVFPINWFVNLLWDSLLKPLLSTLQPDIEDKVFPSSPSLKFGPLLLPLHAMPLSTDSGPILNLI